VTIWLCLCKPTSLACSWLSTAAYSLWPGLFR